MKETKEVQLWFMGRLVTASGYWVSAEYDFGYLVSSGYWEVTSVVDQETQDDAWLTAIRHLSPGDREDWDWIDTPLLQLVEAAFTDTINQQESLNIPTYSYKKDHLYNFL